MSSFLDAMIMLSKTILQNLFRLQCFPSFFSYSFIGLNLYSVFAIIIEQFLRKWRLGQLYHGKEGWRQHFRPNIWKANIFWLLLWRFNILRVNENNAFLKKYSTLQHNIIIIIIIIIIISGFGVGPLFVYIFV